MDTAPVIDISGLTKSFGHTRALRGVDLQVLPGSVHGFLGPNGAGKTTTLRILLGLIRADGGQANVWGQDAWADALAIHERIAYVPGDVSLWPTLTGGEAIDVLARLRGSAHQQHRQELIERFELDPRKRCGDYSKGNRQKVALVAAFAADAELLILDEPSTGLDPLMEAVFRDCVAEHQARGGTVLLSSHTLDQVEHVCDVVSILRDGRIIESGTLAQLRHLTRTSVRAVTRAAVPDLAAHTGVHDVRVDGSTVSFTADSTALDEVVGILHKAGIVSLVCQPPSLEELFLRHYSISADDERAAT